MALGFVEADLVAFGSVTTVHAAIDARRENRNVLSNNELMRLVNDLDSQRLGRRPLRRAGQPGEPARRSAG